jgi:hypothetical protein
MALTTVQSGIIGATPPSSAVSVNFAVPIIENSQIISSNYSITTGSNASTTGPVVVANGVTVTVPSGSVWRII